MRLENQPMDNVELRRIAIRLRRSKDLNDVAFEVGAFAEPDSFPLPRIFCLAAVLDNALAMSIEVRNFEANLIRGVLPPLGRTFQLNAIRNLRRQGMERDSGAAVRLQYNVTRIARWLGDQSENVLVESHHRLEVLGKDDHVCKPWRCHETGFAMKIFRPWRIASVISSGTAQQNQAAALICSGSVPTPMACKTPKNIRKVTNANVTT